jgi:hypothetical protein
MDARGVGLRYAPLTLMGPPCSSAIISRVSRRAGLIIVLLLGIAASSVGLLLQGEGSYLIGVMIAIGFWSLFGLALMMCWTFSLRFWGGLSDWLRNRRR